MKNYIKMSLLGGALAALLLPAAAQTSSPQTTAPASAAPASTSPVPAGPETAGQVGARKENQQDRIANGIGNGSLSPGEAANLEKKESELNQEERDMRKMDNGHLTTADRATLQQQQNQLSNQIYKDKHNDPSTGAAPQPPTTQYGKRKEGQQARIAQGINSGQLNAGEAANLESREATINQEVKKDRAANGGHMTAAERAQVNRQQNGLSKQIYKDKHNGRQK